MTSVATSEVLNRAADLIEERGWVSGTGWTDKGGPLCLEGAIGAVLGVGERFTEVWHCPAARAVESYLSDRNTKPLFLWNDRLPHSSMHDPRSPEYDPRGGWVGGSQGAAYEYAARTVIEVLRAAAVIEAARENADSGERVSA